MKPLFEGVYTALITPFKEGKIDFESLERLIESQLSQGIEGFVVNGTTAESPTLSDEESFSLLTFAKEKVQGRVPLVFGSGSNSTEKTMETSKKAEELGADGLLVVVPYYNKPPQAGLVQHFKAVAEFVKLPIMLYNVPGRTVISMTADTVKELSALPNIKAIKEASGDLELGQKIIELCPSDFIVSSGDDETCLSLKKLGGRGVVSVCSHILPQKMVSWFHGSSVTDEQMNEFESFLPMIGSLYISANPIPTKQALCDQGLIDTAEVRLPLVTMDMELKTKLQGQMKALQEALI